MSDYTRIPEAVLVKVSLPEIFENEMAPLRGKASELSKVVVWSLKLEAAEFAVDPALFSRAIYEVLLNALEFFRGGEGSVAIFVLEDRNGLVVEIADNGIGIRETDMPYVFDPFFTTKAVGVGMGLCRVRRIIGEHGGDVRIDSEPGKGVSVIMRIPHRVPESV